MTTGKPSVHEIAHASDKYEVVVYRGVEILMLKSMLHNSISVTAEFTHSPAVEELAETCGIKLRRFR